MSGLKSEQVSSNWKRLQQRLQAGKKQPQESNGVKRKRTDEENNSVNGFKKPKTTEKRFHNPAKNRRMGTTTSKPGDQNGASSTHSRLTSEHNIKPSDISAAYGAASQEYVDEVNAGRHPTHRAGKFLSLDCEMVGTGAPPLYQDHILARASLVNFHGEQVYDSYVLPPPGYGISDVKDYRTHVSGIKPSHLQPGVARTFTEVQKEVAGLLDGKILVGHALSNDLKVLGLGHPKRDLRDTSRYAKFRVESKGKPPALRNLARQELGLEIQKGAHSSVEDARAAMGLFRKEKSGFEEENRRVFGVRRAEPKEKATDGRGRADGVVDDAQDGEDEGDEESDLDLLDGEELDELEDNDKPVRSNAAPMMAKKKHKKKKRTKRK
ncbi:3'-5' exonuclease [Extremus antarcticus]|uniref:RNA exonuclease 4 n=1 Tax=Extremus antarcticus TaxID=702011 RepID=A0AAJ0G8S8_9PEZI|nr:3'-5' exonuclease [Extremus antarcticus]